MMNIQYTGRVEKTSDTAVVNTLLEQGWILIDVVVNFKKEFVFLLAQFDSNRFSTSCK